MMLNERLLRLRMETGAEPAFDWKINWDRWLLICSTDDGLIIPSSPSQHALLFWKILLAQRSGEQKIKSGAQWVKWLHSVGLISSPSFNNIGPTPVGACNQALDPESALKNFTAQVHRRSHHNSTRHSVRLSYEQRTCTHPRFSGIDVENNCLRG